MPLPPDFQQKLLEAIRSKGINPTCELCGHNTWAVVDQAISVQVTDLSGSFSIPPPQIPSAGLVCNHCGNIRFLALGALGLLPAEKPEKK